MQEEHPTGLELRFERELKASVPGWHSELQGLDTPIEPRLPRKPSEKRRIPRHRPLHRRVRGQASPGWKTGSPES